MLITQTLYIIIFGLQRCYIVYRPIEMFDFTFGYYIITQILQTIETLPNIFFMIADAANQAQKSAKCVHVLITNSNKTESDRQTKRLIF